MRSTQMPSILNALGCGLVILTLSGCSIWGRTQTIQIDAEPISQPVLVLPAPDQLFFRQVEWTIITPSNQHRVFDTMSNSGQNPVLFGLTDQGYEALSLNLNDLRSFVQQQQAIIAAYERYYNRKQEVGDSVVEPPPAPRWQFWKR